MDLYEAIFVRKTVRKYTFDPISEEVMDQIRQYFRELPGLFGNIRTDIAILDNRHGQHRAMGLFGIRAPYYLAFYTEDAPRSQMNIGYLMQQMALYLCTKEYGSCFMGRVRVKRELQTRGEGMRLAGILAFGKSREPLLRRRTEMKRLSIDELCVFKEVPRQWMKQLLEAARSAPSAANAQPWRFVVYDNRIHIFTKKHRVDRLNHYQYEEMDFGGMLAHIMIAAEELWLDVDLIRLDNVSQKNFPNNQYVLSAILKS